MKRILFLTALVILFHSVFGSSAKQTINKPICLQKDSLNEYTGDYKTINNPPAGYATISVVDGKLIAKSSTGTVLTLDHLSGDNFNIAQQGVSVKFLRDASHKINQIAINGQVMWVKITGDKPPQNVINPAPPVDYLGKYQITMNGQQLLLEVSLKSTQLWCTQLWDGIGSPIDYIAGDNYNVRNLSIPLKFKRDKDNKVIQLVLNNADVFIKLKS